MNLLNCTKFFNAIPPGVIRDAAAFPSNVIDRQSFLPTDAKGVLFVVALGTLDADASVFKVQEAEASSDATTLTNPTDVVDVTTKPGDADDNEIWLIYVPISKWNKRYLQLAVTAGDGVAGTYLAAVAIADTPGVSEPTAAALNAGSLTIA